MEDVLGNLKVTAKTLVNFLTYFDRYNGEIQQYIFSDKFCEGQYETVILDEASTQTEENVGYYNRLPKR